MKGLVIHSNWLEKILLGEKTWELRSRPTRIRGHIALIQKGSGHVYAIAELVGVEGPLSETELLQSTAYHRVPQNYWEPFADFKWRYAWVLRNVEVLEKPVPYTHRPGAVIWVELDHICADSLLTYVSRPVEQRLKNGLGARTTDHIGDGKRIDQRIEISEVRSNRPKTRAALDPTIHEIDGGSTGAGRDTRKLQLTQGNINNGHIYLREISAWLPRDVIGGPNRQSKADRCLTVHWGGPEPITTDIAGDKMIFRSRGWMKSFFRQCDLKAGDWVILERTGDHALSLYPAGNLP